jgi:hypothetical protein
LQRVLGCQAFIRGTTTSLPATSQFSLALFDFATKTPEQQSCLLHRTRHLFIRQQTAVINAIRGHLAEFGIVAPVGRNGVEQLLADEVIE